MIKQFRKAIYDWNRLRTKFSKKPSNENEK